MCPPRVDPQVCTLVQLFGRRSDLLSLRYKHLLQVVSFLVLCFNLGNDGAQIRDILRRCQTVYASEKCTWREDPPLLALYAPRVVAIDVTTTPMVSNVRNPSIFPPTTVELPGRLA